VAQEFLHRPDIIALLEQVRRTAVPQGVTTGACGEPSRTTSRTDGPWPPTLMGVMAADDPRLRVFRQSSGGKGIWPAPEAAGTGVLALQGTWSGDWGAPVSGIWRREALDARAMVPEGGD
jgi:hypothetical protein